MSELKEQEPLSAEQIVNAVNAKVVETLQIAEQVYRRKFKMPTIKYSVKGDTAGWAHYQKWEINLNLFYLNYEHKDMIEDTVPHEIAHLVAFKLYGRKIKPHGWQWQGVMRQFGLDPKRCHEYEESDVRTQKRQTRKFVYSCFCSSGITAGLNVHRKIQNGSHHHCRTCKRVLIACEWKEV